MKPKRATETNPEQHNSVMNRKMNCALLVTCFLLFLFIKDPNADTEWNDILRRKGILPPKEEPKEEEEEEQILKQQSIGTLDSLMICPQCVQHAINQRCRTENTELTMKFPH